MNRLIFISFLIVRLFVFQGKVVVRVIIILYFELYVWRGSVQWVYEKTRYIRCLKERFFCERIWQVELIEKIRHAKKMVKIEGRNIRREICKIEDRNAEK